MTAASGGLGAHDMVDDSGSVASGRAVSANDLNLIVEDTYWTADLQDKAADLHSQQQFTLTFPDGRTLTLAMVDHLQLTVNLGSEALVIGL